MKFNILKKLLILAMKFKIHYDTLNVNETMKLHHQTLP